MKTRLLSLYQCCSDVSAALGDLPQLARVKGHGVELPQWKAEPAQPGSSYGSRWPKPGNPADLRRACRRSVYRRLPSASGTSSRTYGAARSGELGHARRLAGHVTPAGGTVVWSISWASCRDIIACSCGANQIMLCCEARCALHAFFKKSRVRRERFSSSSSFINEPNFLVVSELSAQGHRRAHIGFSQLRVGVQYIGDLVSLSEQVQNQRYGDSRAADDRLAAQDLRIGLDAFHRGYYKRSLLLVQSTCNSKIFSEKQMR